MQNCATQFHMKNITLTIDDETHRVARVRAAELGTSVSAMVKDYLNGLADSSPPEPQFQGVREMPMPYIAQPAGLYPQASNGGPPWLVGGEWVYTPDGKPRKPGGLKGGRVGAADDLGEWPLEMQVFFEKLQGGPLDDAFDALP
jgi:hypothetical protein